MVGFELVVGILDLASYVDMEFAGIISQDKGEEASFFFFWNWCTDEQEGRERSNFSCHLVDTSC